MNKTIYSVIIGKNYTLNEPAYITKGWKYICYTNNYNIKSGLWDMKYITNNFGLSDLKLSRRVKIVPPFDADLSIYLDTRFTIRQDLDRFVKRNLKHNMAVMKHNRRDCLYKEAKLLTTKDVNIAMEYRRGGMPERYGLFAPGIMIRRHTTTIAMLMDNWFYEVQRGSGRDQIALAYILWKNKYNPDLMPFRKTYREFMDKDYTIEMQSEYIDYKTRNKMYDVWLKKRMNRLKKRMNK